MKKNTKLMYELLIPFEKFLKENPKATFLEMSEFIGKLLNYKIA